MKIIKSTLVAGLISILAIFSANAEKVKIGDPGWTGATAIANLLAKALEATKFQLQVKVETKQRLKQRSIIYTEVFKRLYALIFFCGDSYRGFEQVHVA